MARGSTYRHLSHTPGTSIIPESGVLTVKPGGKVYQEEFTARSKRQMRAAQQDRLLEHGVQHFEIRLMRLIIAQDPSASLWGEAGT
jgi:hypothetical protein